MDDVEIRITGRIAAEPKITPAQVDTKGSGEILKASRTSFSVIVNKPWVKRGEKNDHDTFSCVMFGPAGEKVAKYLTPGKTVLVKARPTHYDIGAVTPDGKKVFGTIHNVGPYGVVYGPDSQKVRTAAQVNNNNTATEAVLAGLKQMGLPIEEMIAKANAALKTETKPAAATAATGPEVDLPFGDGDGTEG
jgi:single-stranded DNA-binding protein